MLPSARDRLEAVEHIVVLQLENRSFDHMLGYLALPKYALAPHDGELDSHLNGLGSASRNLYKGSEYWAEPLDEEVFDRHDLDPPHDADAVERQLAGGAMSGFLDVWAAKLHKKSGWLLKRSLRRLWAKVRRRPYPDPDKLSAVMGHTTPDHVPVFDHLARNFCVCDCWFCSVAGPTMPNRFFSVAGTHDDEMSNVKLLVWKRGKFESLFQHLQHQGMWRWYSSDPGVLRAIDGEYEFDVDPEFDHFAYFDTYTDAQPRTFLSDVLETEELPEVAWIDPNFAIHEMVPLIGEHLDTPGSNDDHPPSKLAEAQKLANKVYEALGRSKYWDRALFVIYYDEHGGFHDHEPPPNDCGPRVPAIVAGGCVRRGVCHETFDHASLIKTILLRFGKDNALDSMPPRVRAANDLTALLRDPDDPVPFAPVAQPGVAAVTADDLKPRYLEEGASRASRALEILDRALTDLQELIVRYHAIPLRTGRQKLPLVPTTHMAKVALKVAREKPRRLPPRRP